MKATASSRPVSRPARGRRPSGASWRIGTVFGIAIRIHATFPLLLLWIGTVQYAQHRDWADALAGVGLTLAIFGAVLLHELGHALVARRYGIRTRDITLLPIGGIARLQRLPRRPRQELWIALAGPAVNVVLAGILLAITAVRGAPLGMQANLAGDSIVGQLAWLNLGLAVFNLLPAFPMDGGRVLRAVLALRIDYLAATDAAIVIGRGFAVLFAVAGLLANPFLLLIGVFVWFGAEQEGAATRLHAAVEGLRAGDVMMTEFHVLAPDEPLQRAVDYAQASRQQHFPVVADDAVVGLLAWEDLLAGLAATGPATRVGDRMRARVRTANESDRVEHVLERAHEEEARAVPVLRDGRLAGLFTLENLAETILLHEAAKRAAHGEPRTWAHAD